MIMRGIAFSFFILILLLANISATEIIIEEQIIEFSDITRTDRSIVLSLPADAEVSYFSFELTGPEVVGSEQAQNITLDIGDNGTIDWAMKYQYGPLGYQNVYNNGEKTLDLSFILGNYNTTGGIFLPITAEIDKAEMKVVFSEEHYITPEVTELNRPEWHSEAPYDYDPEFCIFQDKLYVAYRSYSWRDSNQSDADIVVNSTHDGIHWQDKIIEITKAPDTEVPYTGGKRSGDYYPSMTVFKNELYCAWESDSPLSEGSTHGKDRDIVWSRFDGTSWLAPQELTAPDTQAAENIYSKNPGIKDDYRVHLYTFDNGSGEQLFAIWTANNTGDEEFPEERKGDIVISRTIDGETWTTGLDLTHYDRRYDEDYFPQLVEFETPNGNALFAFWVSNNFANTDGSDWDIVYRISNDGVSWGSQYNLLNQTGVIEPGDSAKAIDDDPSVIVYNNKLYAIWRTSNPTLTNGDDIDIVFSYTSDGVNWSKPKELTLESDSAFNNRPNAVVYQDNLVVLWRSITPDDSGVIELRLFNKTLNKWTDPVTISPKGEGGDDYSADIVAFDDKIMIVWVTQDNITTRGRDSDVVVRWLIPRNGTPEVALDVGCIGEYNDKWLFGKRTLQEGKIQKIDFTNKLQNLLKNTNWVMQNTIKDEFRNDVYYIPINMYFSSPGRVTLKSLQIQYNYSYLVPDLSLKLTEYISKLSADGDSEEDVLITLRFESDTNGKLRIKNLKIRYAKTTETRQYPELICIGTLIVCLIILGILLKIAPFKPVKSKKKNKEKKS